MPRRIAMPGNGLRSGRAFAPIICVVVLNFVFSQIVIPTWDAGYLAEEQFGRTNLNRVLGTWSTILSMVVALLITIGLHFRSMDKLKVITGLRCQVVTAPDFNTASEYGYGNTIRSLAGFAIVQKLSPRLHQGTH